MVWLSYAAVGFQNCRPQLICVSEMAGLQALGQKFTYPGMAVVKEYVGHTCLLTPRIPGGIPPFREGGSTVHDKHAEARKNHGDVEQPAKNARAHAYMVRIRDNIVVIASSPCSIILSLCSAAG